MRSRRRRGLSLLNLKDTESILHYRLVSITLYVRTVSLIAMFLCGLYWLLDISVSSQFKIVLTVFIVNEVFSMMTRTGVYGR